MKIRKLALTLALALTGSLVACNGSTSSDQTSTNVDTTTGGNNTTVTTENNSGAITAWNAGLLAALGTYFPGDVLPVAPLTPDYEWVYDDEYESIDIYNEGCGDIEAQYVSILTAAGFILDAEFSGEDEEGYYYSYYKTSKTAGCDFCVEFIYVADYDEIYIYVFLY